MIHPFVLPWLMEIYDDRSLIIEGQTPIAETLEVGKQSIEKGQVIVIAAQQAVLDPLQSIPLARSVHAVDDTVSEQKQTVVRDEIT